jgi:hypothetical protein
MKSTVQVSDFEADDEITEEALDASNEAATEFLEEIILPLLDQFESENDNENYVSGVASFMLYANLIEHLTESGWSTEELKKAIDEFSTESITNRTLH